MRDVCKDAAGMAGAVATLSGFMVVVAAMLAGSRP